MRSSASTDAILTNIQSKSDSQYSDYSSGKSLHGSGDPKGDLSQSTSRSSLESVFIESQTPVIHSEVAKWVAPGGLPQKQDLQAIAVIGTGDFGRALAGKMVQAGYKVTFGSRNPNRNREFIESVGAHLTTVEDAVVGSDLVVVAIPKDFYVSLPVDLLSGKVVIDVSNRSSVHRKMEISQAEYLQGLLPRSSVVKAFNVLSAYVLENGGSQGTKEVYYAGDIHSAKEQVLGLIRGLGFTPVDKGGLRSAREIEDIPVQRFPRWKYPMIVSSVVFIIFFLLALGKFQVCWTLSWDGHWHWDRWNTIPLTTLNSALCCHALTMLALCYLPGVLAAYIQIARGTKYSRFPKWLDHWLKMRKQLGLLMLFTASLHACMMMAVFSPKTQSIAFEPPETISIEVAGEGNLTETNQIQIWSNTMMKWRGECFLTAGVVAFLFAILLGITSLPSVSASLSWKEFAFIQSNLGWWCLIFSCAHDLFYGWPYINGPSCGIPSSFQYVMYIPGLTILLKIPLILPGISCYLDKIRTGYERHSVFNKVVVDIKPGNQETWTDVSSKEKSQGVLLPSFYSHSNSGMMNTRTT